MNIFEILNNLYTNPKCRWIVDIDDESSISPYLIQRWLAMDDKLRVQVRWLDKYTFDLPPRMYLSLAWSIIPKVTKMPFLQYIKSAEDDKEYSYVLELVRKQYQLSDNDYNSMRSRLIAAIKKDMAEWFTYYGVEKKMWKANNLDFNLIKELGTQNKVVKISKGLEAWS